MVCGGLVKVFKISEVVKYLASVSSDDSVVVVFTVVEEYAGCDWVFLKRLDRFFTLED